MVTMHGTQNSPGSRSPKVLGKQNGHVPNSEPDDEPLAGAIRTLFCSRYARGTRAFLSATDARIARCESELTAAARLERPRIEAALHAAGDAQDGVYSQAHRLDDARAALAGIGVQVESHAAVLEERVRVRKNLDEALALVAHTRKLIRTYARVEDVIASRRLHTALHMLDTIQRNDAQMPDAAALLDYLYPRARRLRADVAAHAERGFMSALHRLDSVHGAVGRYAIAHEGWLPELSVDTPLNAVFRARSLDTGERIPPRMEPASLNISQEHDLAAPTLYLQPLLQAVQVYADLNRASELRTSYRRHRQSQLRAQLDAMRQSSIASVENALECIAGIIVVERFVANTVSSDLVDGVAVKEMWRQAYRELQAVLLEQSKLNTKDVPLFRVRALKSTLESFSVANSLPS